MLESNDNGAQSNERTIGWLSRLARRSRTCSVVHCWERGEQMANLLEDLEATSHSNLVILTASKQDGHIDVKSGQSNGDVVVGLCQLTSRLESVDNGVEVFID